VLYGLAGFGLRSATTTDSGEDVAVLELYSVDGRSWTASRHFLGQRIHCGQLILGKITKIGATRCLILTFKAKMN